MCVVVYNVARYVCCMYLAMCAWLYIMYLGTCFCMYLAMCAWLYIMYLGMFVVCTLLCVRGCI